MELIRGFAWQWHTSYGPRCPGRALARWLGVSHTYIQKLVREFATDPSKVQREERILGWVTAERLRRAQEETREQRELGWLRPLRRWKTVEYRVGDSAI